MVLEDYIHMVICVRGDDTYAFFYHPEQKQEIKDILSRFSLDRGLSFNWYDAAILSTNIRNGNVKKFSSLIDFIDMLGAIEFVYKDNLALNPI
jgi:hypothetical protein